MIYRYFSLVAVIVSLLFVIANNGSATTFISDPIGDSIGNADITEISGGYASDTLYLGVTFSQATFDPGKTSFYFYLDTDTNPNTGSLFSPKGADYSTAYDPLRDAYAYVYQIYPTTAYLGDVPVSRSDNSFLMSIPLSLISDDGIAGFGGEAGDSIGPGASMATDWCPLGYLGEGTLTSITTPVPEASIITMLFSALLTGLFYRTISRASKALHT